jgi:hypothetical protein
MLPTVYISLASLPDNELLPTLRNAFESAEFPERIHIGLVAYGQDKATRKQLAQFAEDHITFTYRLVKIPRGSFEKKIKVLGVGANRNAALSLFNNQDYILQVDAHTLFAANWDSRLIAMHQRAAIQTQGKIPVLTAYASSYHYIDGKRQFFTNTFAYSTYMSNRTFFGVIPGWTDLELTENYDTEFLPARKFSANFAFTSKEFASVDSLPSEVLFYEEEPLQSVELYSKNFALVFPIVTEPLIGHYYYNEINDENTSRTPLMDYAKNSDVKNSPEFLERVKNTYLGYLENNKDKVRAYENYAKTNMRVGTFKDSIYIPKEY